MAKTVFHAADSRGDANHGWLHSKHTFSFANYYHPERIHFGALRVLNDDTVAAGMGFGAHPHDNMEIISIPLSGDLEHKDSMGNTTKIKAGDVQIMSAGIGVQHSEFNANKDREVKFLQIWVFPNKRNVAPRYDQITLLKSDRKNKLQQIISPHLDDEGMWMHQNAWFHLIDLEKGLSEDYQMKDKNNGLYVFNLSGTVKAGDWELNDRDGLGIWEIEQLQLEATTDTSLLLIEVPMNI
jgi:redox-sensitive bicupin YhaK (pirin superfamily)